MCFNSIVFLRVLCNLHSSPNLSGLCEVNMKNRANTRRISFGKFVLYRTSL
ncbi:hypothetical protein MtrunA17_Chr1g0178251 [Medicago truncatula]|uniref:Uncharacterized protein n=1 Tax=Medicago truncatula TaxID=3880 RepID=A0A396JRW5_MEDTR|nr:hypothetical protein MtrunA17_Chr1g0178251 [Medicago truncatula]